MRNDINDIIDFLYTNYGYEPHDHTNFLSNNQLKTLGGTRRKRRNKRKSRRR